MMQRRVLLKSTAATLLALRGSGRSSLVAPAIAQPAITATTCSTRCTRSDRTAAPIRRWPRATRSPTTSSPGASGCARDFFHDGSPVRATDCIASIQRWCVRDPFGQLLAAAVDHYSAADDRTLVIKLNQPFPLLVTALGKADSSV